MKDNVESVRPRVFGTVGLLAQGLAHIPVHEWYGMCLCKYYAFIETGHNMTTTTHCLI